MQLPNDNQLLNQVKTVLSEISNGIIFFQIKNNQTDIIYANKYYFSILGSTNENQYKTYEEFIELIHPEDRNYVIQTIKETHNTNKSFTIDFRIINKLGETIWLREQLSTTHFIDIEGIVIVAFLSDITSEMQYKEQLTKTNSELCISNNKINNDIKQLNSLMSTIPAGYARFSFKNDKLVIIFINKVLCEYQQLSFEEILLKNKECNFNTIHPDDISKFKKTLKAVQSNYQSKIVKCRLLTKNNDYKWVSVTLNISEDNDSNYFFNAYFTEITKSEKEILDKNATLPFVLEALMQSNTDIAFSKDLNFRYTSCSKVFIEFLGMKNSNDIIGKTDYELFPQTTASKFRREDITVYQNKVPIVSALDTFTEKNGSIHYYKTEKFLLKDTTNTVIGMFGIGRDITEYKTHFEQLELLSNSTNAGLALLEVFSNKLKFIYFNDEFFNFSEYSPIEIENMIKKDPFCFVHPSDKKDLFFFFHTLQVDKIDHTFKYRGITQNGVVHWFNIRTSISEVKQNSVIVNILKVDYTKERELQKEASIKKEELFIAMSQMNKTMCEYYPVTNRLEIPELYAKKNRLRQSFYFSVEELTKNIEIDSINLKKITEFFKKIKVGNKEGECKIKVKRNSLSWNWELYRFISIFNDDGSIAKSIISIEDITDKELSLLRYENEKQLHQQIYTDSLLTIKLNITKSIIEEANNRLNDIPNLVSGCEITPKMYEYILQNIHPEDRQYFKEEILNSNFLNTYNSGISSISRIYRRKYNNDYIWVKSTLNVLKRPDTEDIVVFMYVVDIDNEQKQKLALQKVIEKEIELISILNLPTNKIIDICSNPNIDDEIQSTPIDFELGVEQNISKNNFLNDKDKLEAFFKKDNLINSLNKSNSAFITYSCINKTIKYKVINAFYLNEDKKDIVFSRKDITDLTLDEQNQKEILKKSVYAAEKANLAKSEFLSRISHDMRTPLNAILSFSSDELINNASNEKLLNYIKKIHSSGDFLTGIINDVLDMSRIEQNKMELSKNTYSITEFSTIMQNLFAKLSLEKKITLNIDYQNISHKTILTDKTRFNQIFMNLLSNAVKFTPENGKIEMLITTLPSTEPNYANVQFIVSDTGIGMSEKFLPHAFDIFCQEERKTTLANQNGTGLGLSIVKQLVTLMNGTISVKSKINQGTTFTIILPLQIVDNDDSQQTSPTHISLLLKDKHILLCEDNEINREVDLALLEKYDAIIDCAYNGEEGINKFKHSKPFFYDIILMDIRMPILNGIEASKQIRNLNREDSKIIPIIALTADAFDENKNLTKKAGMNAHLSKPIDPNELYSTITSFLQKDKQN